MRKMKRQRGSVVRAGRRLLELRRSITTEYWRKRRASQEPMEEPLNIEEMTVHAHESDISIVLGELERQQLFLIEEALQRIDAGTYGACTECGGRIRAGRLAAVPWTPLCVECQGALETGEPLRAA